MSAALYFSLQEDHPRHFGRGPLPSSVEDEDDWEINVELSDDDGESPLVTVKQTAKELPDVDDSKPEPKKAPEKELEEPKKEVKDDHQTDNQKDNQKEPNIEIEIVEVSPLIKSIRLVDDPVDSFQEPLKESETAEPENEEPEKEQQKEELAEPQKEEKEELAEPQKEEKEEVSPFVTKKPKKTKGGTEKESTKESTKEEPIKDDPRKEDRIKKDYTKLISDEMNNLCLT